MTSAFDPYTRGRTLVDSLFIILKGRKIAFKAYNIPYGSYV